MQQIRGSVGQDTLCATCLRVAGCRTVHRIVDVDQDYRHRDAQGRNPLPTIRTHDWSVRLTHVLGAGLLLTHPGVKAVHAPPLELVLVRAIAPDGNGENGVRQQRRALRRPPLHLPHLCHHPALPLAVSVCSCLHLPPPAGAGQHWYDN